MTILSLGWPNTVAAIIPPSNAVVTITVTNGSPAIGDFSASPTTIVLGGSTTLTWNATGATSLSIAPAVGTVTGTSTIVSPGTTTTYTLTATNAAGSVTRSVTVTVTPPGPVTYTTSFDGMESIISEGGMWHHNPSNGFTFVYTSGGSAFGSMDNHSQAPYNDSYAFLNGFPPDVYVEAVVDLSAGTAARFQEVEILLRMSDNATQAKCYEITFSFNGEYGGVVRWNGAVNDYTELLAAGGHKPLVDGDVVSAQIVGNIITTRINGALYFTHDISTGAGAASIYATGNPGMGFYRAGGGPTNAFGFRSYKATAL